MKKLKIIICAMAVFTMFNCTRTVSGSSNLHPNFKIGKKGFEKRLQEAFSFEKLSVGTYLTEKQGFNKEKGLTLTFDINNIKSITDSVFNVYADKTSILVKKNLLHLDDYNYVIVKFNEETKGDISKSTLVTIKKELK